MSASPFAMSHSGLPLSPPSSAAPTAVPHEVPPTSRGESAWLRALTIFAIAAVLSLCLPLLAHAGIPDKPATIVTNIVTMLTGLGVGLFTAACMWTGYKMAFAGAQFRDVSNILWGGVLAGGAAGFAVPSA